MSINDHRTKSDENFDEKMNSFGKKLDRIHGNFDERMSVVEETMKQNTVVVEEIIKQNMSVVEESIKQVVAMSVVANFKACNPYEHLSIKSGSQKERRNNFQRQDLFRHHGLEERTVTCMFTGARGKVKLAHLLPINVDYSVVRGLRMENQLNSFRNNLILSENIEKAYDKQRISFTQHPTLIDKFIMKVWDDTVLDEPIFGQLNDSDAPKLSQFTNCLLNASIDMPLNGPHQPFKRILAYHDFMCFMKWSIYKGEVLNCGDDFGSPPKVPWLTQRMLLWKSIQQNLNEETGDADEEGSNTNKDDMSERDNGC